MADVKHCGKFKARLVANGNLTMEPTETLYSGHLTKEPTETLIEEPHIGYVL